MASGDEDRSERQAEPEGGRERGAEPERRKERAKERRFGPGAVGAWTEEELARLPEIHAPPELATRNQDDAELLREGRAIEGRRKAIGSRRPGSAPPYEEETKRVAEPEGRRGERPRERGERRGRRR